MKMERIVEKLGEELGWPRQNLPKCARSLHQERFLSPTKLRIVKCYLYSSLLYCCETWTLYLNDTKRLAAFEMWIYRRLGRIPWTEKRANQYVLNHLNATKSLMKDIKSRKLKYFGHVKRHQNILKSVLEGVTEGRRCEDISAVSGVTT